MSDSQLTPTEVRIQELWGDLLGVSDIHPEQSFFELGGDSLLMIEMIFRLNKTLNSDIDIGLVFEDPSLRGFSKLVDMSMSSPIEKVVPTHPESA